jgi:hypothetical protein
MLASETATGAGDDRNLVVVPDVSHGAGGYRRVTLSRRPTALSSSGAEEGLRSGG